MKEYVLMHKETGELYLAKLTTSKFFPYLVVFYNDVDAFYVWQGGWELYFENLGEL